MHYNHKPPLLKWLLTLTILNLATSIFGSPIFQYSTQQKTSERLSESLLNSSKQNAISPKISRITLPNPNIKIKNLLNELYKQERVSFYRHQSTLWTKATPSINQNIHELITQIPSNSQQILYQFHVYELSKNKDTTQGIQLDTITKGLSFEISKTKPILLSPKELTGIIKHFKSIENAKIKAHPSILVENNQSAILKVGDTIPYINTQTTNQTTLKTIQLFQTGLSFEVHPTIISDNHIQTKIKLKWSHIKVWKQLELDQYPIMAERITETQCILKDGTGIVLSGLMQESEKKNTIIIPLLTQIPIIGDWFKWETQQHIQTNLIIMMQVQIV